VLDPEHRDLIAAGIDGQEIAAVVGDLDRALRSEALAEAGTAGRERRAGQRRQRAIRGPREPGDRVGSGGVVVDINVSGAIMGRTIRARGPNGRPREGQREQRERQRHA